MVQQLFRRDEQQQPVWKHCLCRRASHCRVHYGRMSQRTTKDDEFVLGAKYVIHEASSWCSEKEEIRSSASSSKKGSSDGASTSDGSGATWIGPPMHQFHPGNFLESRALRKGAILGLEHPFDRGKRAWRSHHGRWWASCCGGQKLGLRCLCVGHNGKPLMIGVRF